MFNKLTQKVVKIGETVVVVCKSSGKVLRVLFVGGVFVAGSKIASATPLLPDTGVDPSAFVTEIVTKLGAIVGVVAGASLAFWLVSKSLRKVRGI